MLAAAKPWTVLPGKFRRIQPTHAQEQGAAPVGTLACDLRLAGRLIDEALRNQLPLASIVRKVIDLPARVADQVLIPFALDNAEEVARACAALQPCRNGRAKA